MDLSILDSPHEYSSAMLGITHKTMSLIIQASRLSTAILLVIFYSQHVQAQSSQQQQAAMKEKHICVSLWNQGKLEEAEPIMRRAMSLAESGFGTKHQVTGKIARNLGSLLYQQEKYAEAIRVCQQALSIAESNRDLETLAGTCETLGLAYFHTKDFAKAADAFAQGLPLQRKYHSVLQEGETQVNLGRALVASGQPAKGIPFLKAGFALLNRTPRQSSMDRQQWPLLISQ